MADLKNVIISLLYRNRAGLSLDQITSKLLEDDDYDGPDNYMALKSIVNNIIKSGINRSVFDRYRGRYFLCEVDDMGK